MKTMEGLLQGGQLPHSLHIIVHEGVQQGGSVDELCGGNDKGTVDIWSFANEAQCGHLCKCDAA